MTLWPINGFNGNPSEGKLPGGFIFVFGSLAVPPGIADGMALPAGTLGILWPYQLRHYKHYRCENICRFFNHHLLV
jgi:hypothetical protein